MVTDRLTRGAGLESVELDGEAVVFEIATGRVHRLNATGAAIWRLVDGSRSAATIAASISPDRPSDIEQFIAELVDLGLVH